MKKLFWFLQARIRLLCLYKTNPLPYNEGPNEYRCPNCYWEPGEDYLSDNYLGPTNVHFGYEGGHYWTEHWKCPICGTKFEFDTSN